MMFSRNITKGHCRKTNFSLVYFLTDVRLCPTALVPQLPLLGLEGCKFAQIMSNMYQTINCIDILKILLSLLVTNKNINKNR